MLDDIQSLLPWLMAGISLARLIFYLRNLRRRPDTESRWKLLCQFQNSKVGIHIEIDAQAPAEQLRPPPEH